MLEVKDWEVIERLLQEQGVKLSNRLTPRNLAWQRWVDDIAQLLERVTLEKDKALRIEAVNSRERDDNIC